MIFDVEENKTEVEAIEKRISSSGSAFEILVSFWGRSCSSLIACFNS